MNELPPICEGDERIFTLRDVKSLFQRKRKKILRVAWMGGLLAFGALLIQAPKYRFEATFKEGADKSNAETNSLMQLIGGKMPSQMQAALVMGAYQVLQPLVERLGVNA